MFRTVPLSTIRSYSLYTQQWYICHTGLQTAFEQDQDGRSYSLYTPQWYMSQVCRQLLSRATMELCSILTLLESCLQTCMTYTIAKRIVNNSWWWTEELSETCSFISKQIWEISASSWCYCKEICHDARSHERTTRENSLWQLKKGYCLFKRHFHSLIYPVQGPTHMSQKK
jgi:hypothetical protein